MVWPVHPAENTAYSHSTVLLHADLLKITEVISFVLVVFPLTAVIFAAELSAVDLLQVWIIVIGLLIFYFGIFAAIEADSIPSAIFIGIVYLAYFYILFQFYPLGVNRLSWDLGATLVLGAIFTGIYLLGALRPLTRWDGIALLCLFAKWGGMAIERSEYWHLDGLFSTYNWSWSLQLIDAFLLFLIITRLSRLKSYRRIQSRLIISCITALILVGVVEGYRFVQAWRLSQVAIREFRAERFGRATELFSELNRININLQVPQFATSYILDDLLHEAEEEGRSASFFTEIGDLMLADGHIDLARNAYQEAQRMDPSAARINARQALVLAESGKWAKALQLLNGMIEEGEEIPDITLALGVLSAKQGEWQRAYSYLHAAIGVEALNVRFKTACSGTEGVFTARIGELFAEVSKFYLSQLSLFEVVNILRSQDWHVFHPGTAIGSDGSQVPVDIAALSGGGSTWTQEYIKVDGVQVSRMKRGYNLVVVDPFTGAVKRSANFDTWENLLEGRRLVHFLDAVPEGWIVAGTINDEGTTGLPENPGEIFDIVGASRNPRLWWSHAFIGVKGKGRAVEAFAEDAVALTGVVKTNFHGDPAFDPLVRKEFLCYAAQSSGYVVYISGLEPEGTISVACR